jgi:hypothetical protein
MDKKTGKKKEPLSRTHIGYRRKYYDFLEDNFEVQVFRIEGKENDKADIYGKAFDFSSKKIQKLMSEVDEYATTQIKNLALRDF